MIGLLTAVYGLGWVPAIVWILLAWVVAAVAVALFVGRMIRLRDMDGPPLPPSVRPVDDGEQEWTTVNN